MTLRSRRAAVLLTAVLAAAGAADRCCAAYKAEEILEALKKIVPTPPGMKVEKAICHQRGDGGAYAYILLRVRARFAISANSRLPARIRSTPFSARISASATGVTTLAGDRERTSPTTLPRQ